MTVSSRAALDDARGPRLVEVVDRLLDRGVAIRGDLRLCVADVELVHVALQAVIASPDALVAPQSEAPN